MNEAVVKQLMCAVAGVGIGFYVAYRLNQKCYADGYANGYSDCVEDTKVVAGEAKENAESIERVREAQKQEFVKKKSEEGLIPMEEVVLPLKQKAAVTAMTDYTSAPFDPRHFSKDFVVEGEEDRIDADIPDIPNLAKALQSGEQTVTIEDFAPGEAPSRVFTPPTDNPIQVITCDQFIENNDEYEERTVVFWSKDNVWSDESDEKLDPKKRNDLLGSESVKLLQDGPPFLGGETSVYLRNTDKKLVVEAVWRNDAYATVIEGK